MGIKYSAANGTPIRNMGEKKIEGGTDKVRGQGLGGDAGHLRNDEAFVSGVEQRQDTGEDISEEIVSLAMCPTHPPNQRFQPAWRQRHSCQPKTHLLSPLHCPGSVRGPSRVRGEHTYIRGVPTVLLPFSGNEPL